MWLHPVPVVGGEEAPPLLQEPPLHPLQLPPQPQRHHLHPHLAEASLQKGLNYLLPLYLSNG